MAKHPICFGDDDSYSPKNETCQKCMYVLACFGQCCILIKNKSQTSKSQMETDTFLIKKGDNDGNKR